MKSLKWILFFGIGVFFLISCEDDINEPADLLDDGSMVDTTWVDPGYPDTTGVNNPTDPGYPDTTGVNNPTDPGYPDTTNINNPTDPDYPDTTGVDNPVDPTYPDTTGLGG